MTLHDLLQVVVDCLLQRQFRVERRQRLRTDAAAMQMRCQAQRALCQYETELRAQRTTGAGLLRKQTVRRKAAAAGRFPS